MRRVLAVIVVLGVVLGFTVVARGNDEPVDEPHDDPPVTYLGRLAVAVRSRLAEAIVAADLATLANAGIANFNIDLIAGTLRPDRSQLARIARLDRAARARRTSRSTCWKWMRTAASARRCCSAACATAPPTRPPKTQTADFYEIAVERLAALGIPRYEISNFARPGLRIAAQPEILEARALRRLRRRRPLLRRRACAARIPNRSTEYLRSIRAAGPASRPSRDERFFVGLRLIGRHPPRRPRSGALRRSPSTASWTPACSKPTAASCASPTAASCSPTKSSRSS